MLRILIWTHFHTLELLSNHQLSASTYFESEKVHIAYLCCLNSVNYNTVVFLFSYRHCGVTDPSWSEICHFVTFLDIQLQACETSVFCNEAFVGDVMSGLKSFVVNFMMAMSKVRTYSI